MGKVRVPKIGSRAVTASGLFVFGLPAGLPEGVEVKIIAVLHHNVIGVEFQGQKFEVNRDCLMFGFDFWKEGELVDETDPRVTPSEKRGNS
jgi:hypothetical protein